MIDVPWDIDVGGQEDWVVSPYYSVGGDEGGEVAEGLDAEREGWEVGFDLGAVWVEGEVEIVGEIFEFGKTREHWARVFGPKYDAVGVASDGFATEEVGFDADGGNFDFCDFATWEEGVGTKGVALFDLVEKPFAV